MSENDTTRTSVANEIIPQETEVFARILANSFAICRSLLIAEATAPCRPFCTIPDARAGNATEFIRFREAPRTNAGTSIVSAARNIRLIRRSMKGITSKRAARAYDLSCCKEGADGTSDRQF